MHHFRNKEFLVSLFTGAALLTASFIISAYAVGYATESVSNPVTDIVLSNTPIYDVDGLFVYGAILFVLTVFLVCALKPQRGPFVLKSVAFFIVIRSFFLSLTHINLFPQHVMITPNIITYLFPSFFTGSDLFFSGHTGTPFLLALIFWSHPFLRYVFLGFSILFAVVVLLGHLHYSIDVASAYFITFTVFVMAKHVFKRDWERFAHG